MSRALYMAIARALLAFAAGDGVTAQSITARNLGGGCGGTVGYPAIRSDSSTLVFRVERPLCDVGSFAPPNVLIAGLRRTRVPVPFGPGIAPGCVWMVVPEATLLIPGSPGGTGAEVRLGNPAAIPSGTALHLQAIVTCLFSSSIEHSASDAWELAVR